LNFTVSDNVAIDSCWYKLDGGSSVFGCSNGTFSASAGGHNMSVYTNDTAGNSASASVIFTVDTSNPSISIQSPQNTTYVNNSAPLNFTVSDNVGVGSCWYYLDLAGPTLLPGCLNTTLSGLSQGQHNITVFVNDTAGNTNRSTMLFTIGCPIITASGTYTMNLNYAGAPNSAAPISGSACVIIAAQNVVFNCAGYSIANNLAGTTYGILLNGSSGNVTVKNCPGISSYSYGVYASASSNNNITNNTVSNSSQHAFELITNSNNNVLTNNTAFNSLNGYGVYSTSVNNTLVNNRAYNNSNVGFTMQSGSGSNNLTGNTAANNSGYGFVAFASSNSFVSNNAINNTGYGFSIQSASNNNVFFNNTASNNTQAGFTVFSGSRNNTLANNTAFNNTNNGFWMDSSSNNTLANNTALNSSYGFYIYRANYTSLNGNLAANNSNAGFLLFYSDNNSLSGNNATRNAAYGYRFDTSNGESVTGNTATGNAVHGFFSDCNNCNFTSNSAYSNPNGFYLTNAASNRLVNNLANNSTTMGFELASASSNNLSGNNATWSMRGFSIDSGSGNNLTGNAVSHSNADGISLSGTTGNYLAYNNVTTSSAGFYISGGSTLNRLFSNTASANVQYGYQINGGTSSNNLLSYNNASGNTIYGFYLTNAAGDNLTSNNASGNPIGIYVLGGGSNVLLANNASGNSNNGIQAVNSPLMLVVNNTVSFDSGNDALYLINSSGSTVTGNVAHDNAANGISVDDSTGVLINLNSAFSNGMSGIRTEYTNSSPITGNTAYLNARSGLNVRESMLNNVTNNTAYNNSQVGVFLHSTDDSIISSNSAYSNFADVFINDSVGNLIQDNAAHDSIALSFGSNNSADNAFVGNNASNTLYGFYLENSNNSNITGSIAHDFTDLSDGGGNPDITTGGRAVYLSNGSNNNLIQGNLLYNSSIFGINADHSNGTVIRGNEIYGIVGTDIFVMPGVAIGLADTAATTIDSNSIHDSTGGAVFDTTEVNVLSGNNITNNLWVGVYMEETAYSNFSANRISGSMSGMIHGLSGATSMRNDHFFNNSLYDMNLSMPISFPGAYINLSGVSFDRPAGDFTNYTNLSLDDTLGIEEYTISWSSEPSAPPSRSFAGKFLDISNMTPNVSIDNVIWHWNDAELGGPIPYTESEFQLYRYSGIWAPVIGTSLNTSTNTLSKANLNPASVYAILDVVPPSAHEPEPVLPTLSVDLDSSCDGNTITVNSGSADISGADVLVDNADNLADLGSGTTDGDGQLKFSGCDLRVRIRVTKNGYQTLETTRKTIACEQCVECVTDNNCPDNKVCSNEHCIGFSCSCGYPQNHRCASYQCCSDGDCSKNMTCVAHSCKVPEVIYECYSDKDCKDSQSCDIKAGDKGGKCKEITGCGEVKNHALNPYQCGTAPGCPSCGYGQTCVDTVCKTFGLKGPNTGFVGDSAPVQATEDNKSCVSCDLRITDPTGNILTGKTDSLGNFTLPLKTTGTYKVAYIRNGTVVKVVEIRALPKAPGAGDENPPTATGGELAGGAAFLVIALLALIAGWIILSRRRKGEKPKDKLQK
jgi:parallel beta-helix repeat protein